MKKVVPKSKSRLSFFEKVYSIVARVSGTASVPVAAFPIILLWGIGGPFFGFSNTWQLIINTGTTITTEEELKVLQKFYKRLSDIAKSELSLEETNSIEEATAHHERKKIYCQR